jgi:hypothetical protein
MITALVSDSEDHRQRSRRGTDCLEMAVDIIAACLAGHRIVAGRSWPSAPIRAGLAREGITDEATIGAALERLGVEAREAGHRQHWRLATVPTLARRHVDGISPCGCLQRNRDWRLATGGLWVCGLCHPPAERIEVEWRSTQ